MSKGKCTLCGYLHRRSYEVHEDYIIFCEDCLDNWKSNGRDALSGRLQVGNKKEEIN